MSPGDEFVREVLRDRVSLDEAGEQAFAEQLHHRFGVPSLKRVKGAVVGEGPIRTQQVCVGPGKARSSGTSGTKAGRSHARRSRT